MRIALLALIALLAFPAYASAGLVEMVAPVDTTVRAGTDVSFKFLVTPDEGNDFADNTDFDVESPNDIETLPEFTSNADGTEYTGMHRFPATKTGEWTITASLYCGFDFCGDDDSSFETFTFKITVLPPLPPPGFKAHKLHSVVFGFTPKGCRYGCETLKVHACGARGRIYIVNRMSYTFPGKDAKTERATKRLPKWHEGGCRRHFVRYARPDNLYGVGTHRDYVFVENRYGQKSNVKRRSQYVAD